MYFHNLRKCYLTCWLIAARSLAAHTAAHKQLIDVKNKISNFFNHVLCMEALSILDLIKKLFYFSFKNDIINPSIIYT